MNSEDALIRVSEWLNLGASGSQVFVLHGAAGTGKTTLAKRVVESIEDDSRVCVATLTNKAVGVLRSKGLDKAQTLHSLVYRLSGDSDCTCGHRSKVVSSNSVNFLVHKGGCPALVPTFVVNEDSPLVKADLLVLDEVSMIGEEDANLLLDFGVRILALGDPFQLPPIGSKGGYFVRVGCDVFLDEIHRQAAESPVIALATRVREGNGLDLGSWGDSRVVRRDFDLEGELDSQFIVGLHMTRVRYNRLIRGKLGFEGPLPLVGEKLICKQTDHSRGLINGEMWKVIGVGDFDSSRVKLDAVREDGGVEGHFDVWTYGLGGIKGYKTLSGMAFRDRRRKVEFWYGYVITCHSSQGSEWESVVVRDESHRFPKWDEKSRRSWLYTAITRASERVTVVVD